MAYPPIVTWQGQLFRLQLMSALEYLEGIAGGLPPDADYGDITITGGVWTVEDDSHNHILANVTDVTMTVANLNALDDGANTALHFHDADRARANHTGTQTAATISNFAATAQGYSLDLFADPVAPMNFGQQAITGFNIALGAPGSPVDGDIWRV